MAPSIALVAIVLAFVNLLTSLLI